MNNQFKRRCKLGAEARIILHERFPEVFKGKGENKHPLRVGIHADIKREIPEFSSNQVHMALRDYMGGPTYLRNMIEGTLRMGLDGKLYEPVTKEHELAAKQNLQKLEVRYACMNALKMKDA